MLQIPKLVRNSRGQSLIEYVILVALVAVGSMAMVRLLQSTVSVNLAKVVHTLQGDHAERAKYEHVTQRDFRKADFSDFMSGTVGHARERDEK